MDVETGAEKSGHSPNDYRIAEWQSKSYPRPVRFPNPCILKVPLDAFLLYLALLFIYLFSLIWGLY